MGKGDRAKLNAKRGTRRKSSPSAARKPCGRLVQPSPAHSLGDIRQVRERADGFGLTYRQAAEAGHLNTQYGRMRARKLITSDAELICEEYERIERNWRAVSTAPKLAQPSNGPFGASADDMERAKRAQRAFADVTALWDNAPAAGIAVRHVVIKGKAPVDADQARAFAIGLHILARHFGKPLPSVCPPKRG